MTYKAPNIQSGAGASRLLRDLPGKVQVTTMKEPWALLQRHIGWDPEHVYFVADMDAGTLARAGRELPSCDVVVGVGGGSSVDAAKCVAWKRGCRMVLVPTITSVDAPFTNTIAVRAGHAVRYIGDIYPEEVLIDYDLIQAAPKTLNRAGAGDIASIHTALWDWRLAHRQVGEPHDETVAEQARRCLAELDRNADEVYNVTSRGIDTLVDLYRREVAFCAALGSSRPEEGSEHLVAYNIEHRTRRHFLHGDLVGLGIFCMARLQRNEPEWATDLLRRTGLRYGCPYLTEGEIRQSLMTLRDYKNDQGLFFSVVDTELVTEAFVADTLLAMRHHA